MPIMASQSSTRRSSSGEFNPMPALLTSAATVVRSPRRILKHATAQAIEAATRAGLSNQYGDDWESRSRRMLDLVMSTVRT
jgi:hypothetical protein